MQWQSPRFQFWLYHLTSCGCLRTSHFLSLDLRILIYKTRGCIRLIYKFCYSSSMTLVLLAYRCQSYSTSLIIGLTIYCYRMTKRSHIEVQHVRAANGREKQFGFRKIPATQVCTKSYNLYLIWAPKSSDIWCVPWAKHRALRAQSVSSLD